MKDRKVSRRRLQFDPRHVGRRLLLSRAEGGRRDQDLVGERLVAAVAQRNGVRVNALAGLKLGLVCVDPPGGRNAIVVDPARLWGRQARFGRQQHRVVVRPGQPLVESDLDDVRAGRKR